MNPSDNTLYWAVLNVFLTLPFVATQAPIA